MKRTQGVHGPRGSATKRTHRGGRRLRCGGRQNRHVVMARREGPAGVRERGTCMRVHREPGRPCCLRSRERAVTEERGNEARRDGQQGVGATHSTAEAGEPNHRDPVEGRGSRVTEPLEGKMAGTSSPDTVSTKLQRIATVGARCLPPRSEPVTRRAGCGSSARPDLWGGIGLYVMGVGLRPAAKAVESPPNPTACRSMLYPTQPGDGSRLTKRREARSAL